jgi:hypothetical protein
LRHLFHALALRRQYIIQKHDHCLPFQHSAAAGGILVGAEQLIQVIEPVLFDLFIVLAHFFQVKALVLQRMSKLMGHHRTLHLGLIPVQQVHGAGFFVVVAGHLFGKELDEEAVQIERARQQPKFFLYQL